MRGGESTMLLLKGHKAVDVVTAQHTSPWFSVVILVCISEMSLVVSVIYLIFHHILSLCFLNLLLFKDSDLKGKNNDRFIGN